MLVAPEGAGLRSEFAANLSRIRDQFHSLGQQFGHVYRGAGLVDDGSPACDSTKSVYRPTARPGARAPHVRLRGPAGADLSTVELVTGGWTVLVDGAAQAWRAAVAEVGVGLKLTVHGVHPGAVGTDPDDVADAREPGRWRAAYELDEGGAVLVRPDGHVLARWPARPADPRAALEEALTAVLGTVARRGLQVTA